MVNANSTEVMYRYITYTHCLLPLAGKMQFSEEDKQFPLAFMWNDPLLADTILTIDYVHTQPSCEGHSLHKPYPESGPSDGRPVSRHTSLSASKNFASASHAGLGGARVLTHRTLPFTKLYHLHSPVVSAGSIHLRGSFRTMVGEPRHCVDAGHAVRWQLRLSMPVDDFAAVEAVLFSFYKAEEYGAGVSNELLIRILKVGT